MKITTGIARLDAMIESAVKSGIGGGYYYLDCYNQAIWDNISPSITTRMTDDNKFICEVYEDNNGSDTEGQVIQDNA